MTTDEDELRLQEQTVALRARSLNPNDRALAAAKVAEAQQHLATLDAQLGYETAHTFSETFGKNGTLGRETNTEVVLVPRLRAGLERLNPGLADVRRHSHG